MTDTSNVPLNDINNGSDVFSWIDYSLFGAMLGISVIIGLYFGLCGKKEQTANEYIMGGKTMYAFPIAISLVASHISTVTFLGVPADVYRFGANYLWLAFATVIECFLTYYIYLPVFFKLQLTSTFEYLHLRFDKKLKIMTSFFGVLSIILFCPSTIYIPALAFSQVTGVGVHLVTVVTSLLCIFYTTIGGIKAVVWTDTFQFFVMMMTFITIFFLALSSLGGFDVIWERAVTGHRLDIFDFSFNPTLRDSFGALTVGGTFLWLTHTAVSPISLQKFLSVPTFRDIKKTIFFYCIGMVTVHVVAAFTGLLLYAKYWNCDPLLSQQVQQLEQLVPHFAMKVATTLPGLPGIFIAGVFSAGLSSLSACLNTMSAVVYEDFISPFMPKNIAQRRIRHILQLIVVIEGLVTLSIVFVLDKAKGLFALQIALSSITAGPTLGIFSLGMLFPVANSKGALYGSLVSSLVTTWIVVQSQRYQSQGLHSDFLKPTSTEGCNVTVTATSNPPRVEEPFILYQLSFWYYTFLGAILTVVVGLLISCFTKHDKAHVHEDLLSPIIYYFIQKKTTVNPADCKSVTNGIQLEEVPLKN